MQVHDLNLRQKTSDKVKKGVEEAIPLRSFFIAFAWKYDIIKSWIFLVAIVYKSVKKLFRKDKEENYGRQFEGSCICKN